MKIDLRRVNGQLVVWSKNAAVREILRRDTLEATTKVSRALAYLSAQLRGTRTG